MAKIPSGFDGIFINANPRDRYTNAPRYPGTEHGLQKHQFARNVRDDLEAISRRSLGRDLLDLISKRHQRIGTQQTFQDREPRDVTIEFRPPEHPGADTGRRRPMAGEMQTRNFGGQVRRVHNTGTSSTIWMHNVLGLSERIYTDISRLRSPTWIVLAHELIHAFHFLSGTGYGDEVRTGLRQPGMTHVKREEMATVGLGPYANSRLTENALRREAGLPLRTQYMFPDDHAYIHPLTR